MAVLTKTQHGVIIPTGARVCDPQQCETGRPHPARPRIVGILLIVDRGFADGVRR
jgi:hypothetical protein